MQDEQGQTEALVVAVDRIVQPASLPYTVCAVIVTYHPTAEMLENMPRVLDQVQGLVVVDNGSDTSEIEPLRAISRTLGFHLIENSENLGIAEALNQGVLWAKNEGFPWVVLFDQDSGITDGFVSLMFALWESHPHRERVGSIQPRYVDPKTGFEAVVKAHSPVHSILIACLTVSANASRTIKNP